MQVPWLSIYDQNVFSMLAYGPLNTLETQINALVASLYQCPLLCHNIVE